jgi:hypothetical protein
MKLKLATDNSRQYERDHRIRSSPSPRESCDDETTWTGSSRLVQENVDMYGNSPTPTLLSGFADTTWVAIEFTGQFNGGIYLGTLALSIR